MNQDSFKQAIKSYLNNRANTDELFARMYAKPSKNMDECCDYIVGEAFKQGSKVCMSDEETYGLAVHYYTEDTIIINKLPPIYSHSTVSAPPIELTENDKDRAREEAIKRLTSEQYNLIKKKATKKKEATEPQQMSLF